MHEHLVEFLRSALASTDEEHLAFQVLSDEEIAAIDEQAESELSLHPWVDAQDDIDPRICARFGERSLFLRGLLEASADRAGGTADLVVSEDLQLVADARRLGEGHVMMRSTNNGSTTGRYLVLQGSVGGFEEAVDADGLHLFAACTYRAAVDRLAQWALPASDHGGVRMRTRVPADRWHAWITNELGTDVRLVDVKTFLPGPGGMLGTESWLIAHARGVGVIVTPDDRDTLEVSSMTQTRLAELLGQRISAALHVDL